GGSPLENGCEKMLETTADPDPSTNQRQQRQDEQWAEHHPRTFVRLAMPVCIVSVFGFVMQGVRVGGLMFHVVRGGASAIIAEEGHEPQPERVERSDQRGDDADQPIHPASVITGISFPENLVFREKSGKG